MILLELAKKRCRSFKCMPSIRMGPVSIQVRELNRVKVPMEILPMMRKMPPTSSTAMDRPWLRVSI